jgi:hypothetical protein
MWRLFNAVLLGSFTLRLQFRSMCVKIGYQDLNPCPDQEVVPRDFLVFAVINRHNLELFVYLRCHLKAQQW